MPDAPITEQRPYRRPWWDVRAPWIVWLRVRSTVVRDFQTCRPAPWWSVKAWWAATRVWWMHGHGRHLES